MFQWIPDHSDIEGNEKADSSEILLPRIKNKRLL